MQKLDLLDYAAAADFIGLSEYTLRRYVSLGKLPYVKLGAKAVRFEPDQLTAWVESQRHAPRTERSKR